MGATHRFIAHPDDGLQVIEWFRSRSPTPRVVPGPRYSLLHFEELGPLVRQADDDAVDTKRSPVATIFLPSIRRGVLWTVGEVHFLSTPLRKQFPGLQAYHLAFGKWLRELPCVFSPESDFEGEWNYYLEGSIRNYDAPIFAFPSGVEALAAGQYFVAEGDSTATLERVCRALKLRGISCHETEA